MNDVVKPECVVVQGRAAEYVLEHSLPVDQRLRVAGHLSKCPACTEFYREMEKYREEGKP